MTDAKASSGNQGATIELTFMSDAELRQQGGRGIFGPEGLEIFAKFFDASQIEKLRKLEVEVLAWIRRDPRHAVAYLADPFGCIERTGLVDDPALLAKLRQLAEVPRPSNPAIKTAASSSRLSRRHRSRTTSKPALARSVTRASIRCGQRRT